jgi:hypothetical protein
MIRMPRLEDIRGRKQCVEHAKRLSTQWREFLWMFQAFSTNAKRDPPRKIEAKKTAPVF